MGKKFFAVAFAMSCSLSARAMPVHWCAPQAGPAAWEQRFAKPTTVGSILMRTGAYDGWRYAGGKVRDFKWEFLRGGVWTPVPGAAARTERAQLILRFMPVTADAMRLAIRSAEDAPCLRDVEFFASRDAEIPVAPFFLAVATWEEADPLHPLTHWGNPVFPVHDGIHAALRELGAAETVDAVDETWIGGDFEEAALREPRPAGILLSGNYRDFSDVDARTYEPFHRYLREHARAVPILGACGGHQLLAMAVANPEWPAFAGEFGPDAVEQVDVTCSTDPAYACGGEPAASCCYEGGLPDPFRRVAPVGREDLLFHLLPREFDAYLFHADYVNPARIAPWFDLIASYPATVQRPDRAHPSRVQAIKLRGAPVYGTQFHWDENLAGQCDRNDGNRNMERVLKNFVLISLDRLAAGAAGAPEALRDLDVATAWCGRELELRFDSRTDLAALATIEDGIDRITFEASENGRTWKKLRFARRSLFAAQQGCGALPGVEDGRTFLTRFETPARARRLRLKLEGRHACLRELIPLMLDEKGNYR